MKTKHNSFCINKITKGCRHCVKGKKLVLFIGGKCSRNCWYCSLSEGRKNTKQVWANERPVNSIDDIIKEVQQSNADSAGITGGDPLINLDKTIKFAKALKQKFGKKFHIHIYLPLNLVTKEKLSKLKLWIDEVRFHPSFLNNESSEGEIEKIITAKEIFGIKNTGIELLMMPDKKQEIIEFIEQIKNHISFVNLNEFEISDTNFQKMTKDYKINEDTYTISGSIETGKQILDHFKKSKLSIHLCTAKLKNIDQYQNRLKLHKILPNGIKTEEGTVIYFTIAEKDLDKELPFQTYYDKERKRHILKIQDVKQAYKQGFKVARSEEHPTHDKTVLEYWILDDDDIQCFG